ncbi:helix-turn-helix domain-containing protein [Elusimicrobiota bacterium]
MAVDLTKMNLRGTMFLSSENHRAWLGWDKNPSSFRNNGRADAGQRRQETSSLQLTEAHPSWGGWDSENNCRSLSLSRVRCCGAMGVLAAIIAMSVTTINLNGIGPRRPLGQLEGIMSMFDAQGMPQVRLEIESMLSVEQVAEKIQKAQFTVRKWARLGVLPAVKMGNAWRFSPGELQRWMRRGTGRS